MTRFAVWAPMAGAVDVCLWIGGQESRRPLAPAGRGWWAVDIGEAGPGTDYLF
ncbi:MAG TPA: hypothetical protein VHT75_11300 [Acidimicrobiales bacterium]|nr:hypothetical protein [Acidimicrobiales bacterium]